MLRRAGLRIIAIYSADQSFLMMLMSQLVRIMVELCDVKTVSGDILLST